MGAVCYSKDVLRHDSAKPFDSSMFVHLQIATSRDAQSDQTSGTRKLALLARSSTQSDHSIEGKSVTAELEAFSRKRVWKTFARSIACFSLDLHNTQQMRQHRSSQPSAPFTSQNKKLRALSVSYRRCARHTHISRMCASRVHEMHLLLSLTREVHDETRGLHAEPLTRIGVNPRHVLNALM